MQLAPALSTTCETPTKLGSIILQLFFLGIWCHAYWWAFCLLIWTHSKVWRIQAKKKSSKPITNKVRNFSSSRVINKFCINSLRNRTERKYIFFYPLKFFLSLRLEKSFILWIPHFTNLKFFLPRPTSEINSAINYTLHFNEMFLSAIVWDEVLIIIWFCFCSAPCFPWARHFLTIIFQIAVFFHDKLFQFSASEISHLALKPKKVSKTLTIFVKKHHHRCLTGFEIRLFQDFQILKIG